MITAVAIEGGHSGQSGGGIIVYFSQFGNLGQDSGGGDDAHPGNGIQALSPKLEVGIGGNEFCDGGVTGGDLLFQELLELAGLAQEPLIGVVSGAVGFGNAGVDELESPVGELA